MSGGSITALLFEADGQRYGLDISQIVEVVPAVPLRMIPDVPEYVAGTFCYRGETVLVVDLNRLLGGAPAARLFNTRLVVMHYSCGAEKERVIGLLVERPSSGLAECLNDRSSPMIQTPKAAYIGRPVLHGDQTIHLLQVDQLIPEAISTRLFTES